jgi:integral membrane protein (TIGR00529 family)
LVMYLNTLVLTILYKVKIVTFAATLLHSALNLNTLSLVLCLVIISFMEKIMRQSGALTRIIEGLKALIKSRKLLLPIMPAFLGLLPSPGGAMFSAPFVAELDKENSLSPELKTFINYWFRHIWEYILPLYPGILLEVDLLKAHLKEIFALQYPFAILHIALGFIIIFWMVKGRVSDGSGRYKFTALKDIVLGLFPIAGTIVLVLGFKVNLILALALMVLLQLSYSKVKLNFIGKAWLSSINVNTTLLILGVIAFKDMLQVTASLAALSQFLLHNGIPTKILFFALPFLAGFLTGATPSAVAIAFPILINLTPNPALPPFGFAFISAFVGLLLSPMHLCLVLSLDYYNANFKGLYKYLLLPAALMLLAGWIGLK